MKHVCIASFLVSNVGWTAAAAGRFAVSLGILRFVAFREGKMHVSYRTFVRLGGREVMAVDEAGKRQRGRPGRGKRRGSAAEARKLYEDLFQPEERAALAGAAERDDLEQEVELLRVLIRRGVAEGADLETVSRSIGRLAQALRVQRVLKGDAAKSLDEALARALEEIGNELGV